MSSPAERYAAAMRRQAHERTELAAFTNTLEFELDAFQISSCEAVEAGHGVLVAAPTGAGKTVVGEFAVHLALVQGRKAFYTTPIKALSNQKYPDLVRRHGQASVGLLTGDTSVNGDAPVVVMTTEVLRNMLYAGSPTLAGLGFVVMDEVHYLADRFRGPVWEEVILHLPLDVQVVSLSATVSNAEEFGDWLSEVRGECEVIVSEHRPVPLWQHVMVGSGLHDLYSADVDPTSPGVTPPISHDLVEAIRSVERSGDRRRGGRESRNRSRGRYHQRRSMVRPPARGVVVDRLDRAGLLPAIVFIFSRAACDAAVSQVVHSGVRLTTPAERHQIADLIAERTAALPPEDLDVLGFDAWEHALLSGVAAHHAGMLPVFKETVEALFTQGLVKVVFATETLALGINMPARSVVLEKLVKWDGSSHAAITAGEYTQLTGRAGRRGIDVEGHAVVLYASGLDPVALAGLASRRTYPLRSSFRPTYNMAVNLIATAGWERAREVLETSFAQFQADRAVVGLARRARQHSEALAGYADSMACHLGDFAEYMDLRRSISDLESELSRSRSRAQRESVAQTLGSLSRGDVIQLPSGRRAGFAVVLEPPTAVGLEGGSVTVLTGEGQVRRLVGSEVPYGTSSVTRVRIPKAFSGRRPKDRRDLVSSMRNALGALGQARPERIRTPPAAREDRLTALKAQLRAHPCHGCADRDEHARWAHRYVKLRDEHEGLLARIEGRTSSIAREFDKVCGVLAQLGYLSETGSSTQVTERGEWLRRVYSEQDLLVVEALRRGLWNELDPAGLAAVVAAVLYESRSDDASPRPRLKNRVVSDAVDATDALARDLAAIEAEAGLTPRSPLDLGLVAAVDAWSRGAHLDAVITTDLAAGDFVRWSKQVIDLLDQLTDAAPSPDLRDTAHRAVRAVRRGIVALGSV
ncbi:DEAD/DEAH box helicase [Pseudactinotalea sp.]|uniref:DEAD/DEAH box helicase n=1 Tax=Pseudactinotalea sp. TaxID=1926260 RepID=UPI003B3BA864